MQPADKSGHEHQARVITAEHGVHLLNDILGRLQSLDSGTEQVHGSTHQHRCRHALAAHIAYHEVQVIVLAVEVIQVTAYLTHRYKCRLQLHIRPRLTFHAAA